MYLKHNTLGEDIPLVIALKAMGLESDQEIIQLIGIEPDIVDLFSGSLEEPYNIGVYTQQQVLQLYWKVRHGLEHYTLSVKRMHFILGSALHWRENQGCARKQLEQLSGNIIWQGKRDSGVFYTMYGI